MSSHTARVPPTPVDVARRCLEALNSGDLEGLHALVADDIVADVPSGFANADAYRGRDAFRRMLEQWLEPWRDFRAEPLEVIEEGDAIVASVHQSGTGRESGIEVDMDLAYLIRVRDGLLVQWRLCADVDEALALARKPGP
jgi:ketosteroid isomerase-like protein